MNIGANKCSESCGAEKDGGEPPSVSLSIFRIEPLNALRRTYLRGENERFVWALAQGNFKGTIVFVDFLFALCYNDRASIN